MRVIGASRFLPAHPGWPLRTEFVVPAAPRGEGCRVRLRSLAPRDEVSWRELRILNEEYLRPVEPTVADSWAQAHNRKMWRLTYRTLTRQARRGLLVPAAIEVDGRFAGQVTLGNIQHGAVSSCWIGYWVDSRLWGRGVATAAVALGVDHAFQQVGLHRVEATVMEDNVASRRVLQKTGFRVEGRLVRNLHINGDWRDHLLVAQTLEEAGFGHGRGVVAGLRKAGVLLGG